MKAFAFALGLTVFMIGLSSIVGYAVNMERLYTWDGNPGMALNTAIALVMCGVSLCILSSRESCFYVKDNKI